MPNTSGLATETQHYFGKTRSWEKNWGYWQKDTQF